MQNINCSQSEWRLLQKGALSKYQNKVKDDSHNTDTPYLTTVS